MTASLWFDSPQAEPIETAEPIVADVPVADSPVVSVATTPGWYSVHTASNRGPSYLYGADAADAIANFKTAFGITDTRYPIEAFPVGTDFMPSAEDMDRHLTLH